MKQLTVGATPGVLLERPDLLASADTNSLRGFGGLHGGLTLGILASTMQGTAGDRPLRYVTGQFLRAAAGSLSIVAEAPRSGRTTSRGEAALLTDGSIAATASAAFGVETAPTAAGDIAVPSFAPPMPRVAPPDRCETFTIPEEFVPFSRHIEIRPADDNRPFVGGTDPSLTAWIRLVEDDRTPDAPRLITLLDALAPSYAAVLNDLVAIPTLELSVRLTGGHERTPESPWILLRSVTGSSAGGWIDERLDAWSPAGVHLAGASQVRLVQHR